MSDSGANDNRAAALAERRLANIRRNREMLSKLGLNKLPAALRASHEQKQKKRKAANHPAAKRSKKPRGEVVKRRSMRVRGFGPDGAKVEESKASPIFQPYSRPERVRPEGLLDLAKSMPEGDDVEDASRACKLVAGLSGALDCKPYKQDKQLLADIKNLDIKEQHVVKAVPQRVFSIKLHPCKDKAVVFVGEKWGTLGMWRATDSTMEEEALSQFKIHARPITGLGIWAEAPHKVFTCSYDGSVRCFDITSATFAESYVDEDHLFTCLNANSRNGVWVSTKDGTVLRIDDRARGPQPEYELHPRKISALHINPANPAQLVTASLDQTAAVWDIRKLSKSKSKRIGSIQHSLGVTGAEFSPDGKCIVTTSNDNTIRFSDAKGDMIASVKHNNHTGRWLTNFEATFHPRSSSFAVVGNMIRGIDFILPDSSTTTLQGDLLTAVPTLNACHPHLNVIASATASGRVYLWS